MSRSCGLRQAAPIQKRDEPEAKASLASEITLSTAIRFSASSFES